MLLTMLVGCGGGGSGDGSAHGTVRFTLTWPALAQRALRDGMNDANSLVVQIAGRQGMVIRSQTERSFTGVPVGMQSYVVRAYASSDGSGNPLAEAYGTGFVIEDQTFTVALNWDRSSTTHVVISPLPLSPSLPVEIGGTVQLFATAENAEGEVLLVAPGGFAWQSSDSPVATVSANGLVTGIAEGSVTITVTENVSETSATAPVTVAGGSAAGTLGTNPTDGAAMVWVPGGSFTMGTEYGGSWNPATQQVTLGGYWIYQYEVTVAQYRTFCAATGHVLPTWPGNQYSWSGKSGWDDAAIQQWPIVNVTWADAQAYADWAGASLPTEAQWEYAACGPRQNNYPWGGTATADDMDNGWDTSKCANMYNAYGSGISTSTVGSFPAGTSWCNAQDMAGNVWEWCSEWYGPYASTPVTNPAGPATGTERILRGGCWDNTEQALRCAFRQPIAPTNLRNNLGFRCVFGSAGS